MNTRELECYGHLCDIGPCHFHITMPVRNIAAPDLEQEQKASANKYVCRRQIRSKHRQVPLF